MWTGVYNYDPMSRHASARRPPVILRVAERGERRAQRKKKPSGSGLIARNTLTGRRLRMNQRARTC